MQKEKEQQDKLKAVKASLLYGNKSGRNPRNHEESHYSESKMPTARTEPRRRHGRKHSRSPSPVAIVFRRLKQNRSPSPRLRPQKEGGVFNRLGRKEPGAYTRSHSHHQSSQARGTEVPAKVLAKKAFIKWALPSRSKPAAHSDEHEDSDSGLYLNDAKKTAVVTAVTTAGANDQMAKTNLQVSLRDNPALDTPIECLRTPS
ncbi:hypothetical protein Tco_0597484 [Tanacetum coccineum]